MDEFSWSADMLHEIAAYVSLLALEVERGLPVTSDDNRFVQALCRVFWAEKKYPVAIRERGIINALKNLWGTEELKIDPHSNC